MRDSNLRCTLAAGLAVWLVGCVAATPPGPVPTPPAPKAAEPVAPVPLAARVNGQPITLDAFAAEMERQMVRYRTGGHQLPPSIELRVRETVLRNMIEATLLAQKAEELHLEVTDEELRAALAEHKARFRSAAAFGEYLERSHRTEDRVRTELARHLLRTRVVTRLIGQVEVNDAEIRSHYDDERSRFVERERIRASRILIRLTGDARPEQIREARDLAHKIQREANRDLKAFADLARQQSHGPQAAHGGDLGWFPRGRMHPDWDRVAFVLEPGTVSQPLLTEHGFEIIAVWEHRPERNRPLEEVAENIRETLAARKINEQRRAALRDLTTESQVEVLIELDAASPTPSSPAD